MISFSGCSLDELDILVTGLRLVRRGAYDIETRNRAGEMLDDALRSKRNLIRKPDESHRNEMKAERVEV